MQRLLARIAVLSLCAGTVSACGMFGANDAASLTPSGDTRGSASLPTEVTNAVHQAQLLRTKGDNEGATHILSQLMLAAPDDAGVVGEYGKLLLQEGRLDDATQFLRRAIELQPSDWTLYSALGVSYDQLNDQPNAKLAYEHALTLKPGEPTVLNNYAMSRLLAGDTIAAHALMTRAQAGGSTDPKIAHNLALLERMAPVKQVKMQATAASAPPALHTTPVSQPAAIVVPSAHRAPAPITRDGTLVVMQEVPADRMAGPTRVAHPVTPVKVTKARHTAARLAVNAAKPAKSVKPGDHIPALRMTADASKP